MKQFKMSLLIMFIGIIILTIFQNQDFFIKQESLNIDLYLIKYEIPPIHVISMLLICFIFGLLISFLAMFSSKLKLNKTIKGLSSDKIELSNLIQTLKHKLDQISKTKEKNSHNINKEDNNFSKKA